MAYEAKTNWKLDDTVMPDDMNRIEQGIEDVELELGNVNGIVILEASADNVIDFNTLKEPGYYLIKNCDASTTSNSAVSINSYAPQDILLFVTTIFTASNDTNIYQRLLYGQELESRRTYITSTDTWQAWSKIIQADTTAVSALATWQVRNIAVSTTDLTAGTSTLTTGNIYLVYE